MFFFFFFMKKQKEEASAWNDAFCDVLSFLFKIEVALRSVDIFGTKKGGQKRRQLFLRRRRKKMQRKKRKKTTIDMVESTVALRVLCFFYHPSIVFRSFVVLFFVDAHPLSARKMFLPLTEASGPAERKRNLY